MEAVLDTSALIRFFTRDIEDRAQKVKKLLDNHADVFIPDVVFPELEYVLTNAYGQSRGEIIEAYTFLLAQDSIKTSPYLKKAVEIFQSSSLDMADCIIVAHSMKRKLASFDEDMLKIKGVNAFWK